MALPELPDELFRRIERHCEDADNCAMDEDFQAALDHYKAAWDLVPEPREEWSVTLWLLQSIGDVHFLRGAFAEGRDALTNAVAVFPDAPSEPLLCLRLGQCHYELDNRTEARRWLESARRAAGDDVDDLFEEEDPKYLALLSQPEA